MSDFSPISEIFANPAFDPIPAGIRHGDLVHGLRLDGINPDTGEVPNDLEEQLFNAFENLRRSVENAGGNLDNVAQVSLFLDDPRSSMSAVNERWTALFPDADNRPTYKFVPADLPENRVVALEYFAVLGATRQVINIENVAHTNPIPMGVRMGKYIFSSRVLPMDPQTGKYPPDVALQMDVLFGNLDAVLNAGGMTWSNIAQGRLFLADMDNLSAVQRRWAAQFSDTLAPPLHPLEYTAGPLLVMIEFVAVQA